MAIRNYSLDFVPIDDSFSEKSNKNIRRKPNQFGGLIDNILHDKDAVLVIMLILLLYSDNCDKLLILALIYIIS